jgi:hypothetical protein
MAPLGQPKGGKMVQKFLVDEDTAAEILDSGIAKLRRLRKTDPAFPRARALGGSMKYVVSELRDYAAGLPPLVPGERGLRGEGRKKPPTECDPPTEAP